MKSSWQAETGRLGWQWSEVGPRIQQIPPWLQKLAEMPSGYIPPVPDFGSHSPFGGPSWFEPHRAPRDFK